jgi:hypothetical protein
MRLSLRKAAYIAVGDYRMAGNPGPPDFLSTLLALTNFMRLSLRKAACVAVGDCRVAGNPGRTKRKVGFRPLISPSSPQC